MPDTSEAMTSEAASYVTSVLQAFAEADTYDLSWKVDEGQVRLYVRCNDVFWWGSADCEEILPDDVDLLQGCLEDLRPIDEMFYLPELFAARKRGMRPQGAWYSFARPAAAKPLFDAVGPAREKDILNPVASADA